MATINEQILLTLNADPGPALAGVKTLANLLKLVDKGTVVDIALSGNAAQMEQKIANIVAGLGASGQAAILLSASLREAASSLSSFGGGSLNMGGVVNQAAQAAGALTSVAVGALSINESMNIPKARIPFLDYLISQTQNLQQSVAKANQHIQFLTSKGSMGGLGSAMGGMGFSSDIFGKIDFNNIFNQLTKNNSELAKFKASVKDTVQLLSAPGADKKGILRNFIIDSGVSDKLIQLQHSLKSITSELSKLAVKKVFSEQDIARLTQLHNLWLENAAGVELVADKINVMSDAFKGTKSGDRLFQQLRERVYTLGIEVGKAGEKISQKILPALESFNTKNRDIKAKNFRDYANNVVTASEQIKSSIGGSIENIKRLINSLNQSSKQPFDILNLDKFRQDKESLKAELDSLARAQEENRKRIKGIDSASGRRDVFDRAPEYAKANEILRRRGDILKNLDNNEKDLINKARAYLLEQRGTLTIMQRRVAVDHDSSQRMSIYIEKLKQARDIAKQIVLKSTARDISPEEIIALASAYKQAQESALEAGIAQQHAAKQVLINKKASADYYNTLLAVNKGLKGNVLSVQQAEQMLSKYANTIKRIKGGTAAERKASILDITSQELQLASSGIKGFAKESAQAGGAVGTWTTGIQRFNGGILDFNTMMGTAIEKIFRYRIAFTLLMNIWTQFSRLWSEPINFEAQFVKLDKVLIGSGANLNKLKEASIDFATTYGVAIKDVTDIMLIWAQQGKSQSEIIQLTDTTIRGMKAANLEARDAVELLTAAQRIYNVTAEDSVKVFDKILNVERKYAVTTQDLAEAIKTIGVAGEEFGMSMDSLMGSITAIGQVTRRTGSQIATALKTIFAKIFDEDSIRGLRELGVAVMDVTGNYRSLDNILDDLAIRWKTLSEAEKITFSRTVGNIRHYPAFLVLMDQYAVKLKATADSQMALGFTGQAMGKELDTTANQLERLKAGVTAGIIGVGGAPGGFKDLTSNIASIAEAMNKMILAVARWAPVLKPAIGLLMTLGVAFVTIKAASIGWGAVISNIAKRLEGPLLNSIRVVASSTGDLTMNLQQQSKAIGLSAQAHQDMLNKILTSKTGTQFWVMGEKGMVQLTVATKKLDMATKSMGKSILTTAEHQALMQAGTIKLIGAETGLTAAEAQAARAAYIQAAATNKATVSLNAMAGAGARAMTILRGVATIFSKANVIGTLVMVGLTLAIGKLADRWLRLDRVQKENEDTTANLATKYLELSQTIRKEVFLAAESLAEFNDAASKLGADPAALKVLFSSFRELRGLSADLAGWSEVELLNKENIVKVNEIITVELKQQLKDYEHYTELAEEHLRNELFRLELRRRDTREILSGLQTLKDMNKEMSHMSSKNLLEGTEKHLKSNFLGKAITGSFRDAVFASQSFWDKLGSAFRPSFGPDFYAPTKDAGKFEKAIYAVRDASVILYKDQKRLKALFGDELGDFNDLTLAAQQYHEALRAIAASGKPIENLSIQAVANMAERLLGPGSVRGLQMTISLYEKLGLSLGETADQVKALTDAWRKNFEEMTQGSFGKSIAEEKKMLGEFTKNVADAMIEVRHIVDNTSNIIGNKLLRAMAKGSSFDVVAFRIDTITSSLDKLDDEIIKVEKELLAIDIKKNLQKVIAESMPQDTLGMEQTLGRIQHYQLELGKIQENIDKATRSGDTAKASALEKVFKDFQILKTQAVGQLDIILSRTMDAISDPENLAQLNRILQSIEIGAGITAETMAELDKFYASLIKSENTYSEGLEAQLEMEKKIIEAKKEQLEIDLTRDMELRLRQKIEINAVKQQMALNKSLYDVRRAAFEKFTDETGLLGTVLEQDNIKLQRTSELIDTAAEHLKNVGVDRLSMGMNLREILAGGEDIDNVVAAYERILLSQGKSSDAAKAAAGLLREDLHNLYAKYKLMNDVNNLNNEIAFINFMINRQINEQKLNLESMQSVYGKLNVSSDYFKGILESQNESFEAQNKVLLNISNLLASLKVPYTIILAASQDILDNYSDMEQLLVIIKGLLSEKDFEKNENSITRALQAMQSQNRLLQARQAMHRAINKEFEIYNSQISTSKDDMSKLLDMETDLFKASGDKVRQRDVEIKKQQLSLKMKLEELQIQRQYTEMLKGQIPKADYNKMMEALQMQEDSIRSSVTLVRSDLTDALSNVIQRFEYARDAAKSVASAVADIFNLTDAVTSYAQDYLEKQNSVRDVNKDIALKQRDINSLQEDLNKLTDSTSSEFLNTTNQIAQAKYELEGLYLRLKDAKDITGVFGRVMESFAEKLGNVFVDIQTSKLKTAIEQIFEDSGANSIFNAMVGASKEAGTNLHNAILDAEKKAQDMSDTARQNLLTGLKDIINTDWKNAILSAASELKKAIIEAGEIVATKFTAAIYGPSGQAQGLPGKTETDALVEYLDNIAPYSPRTRYAQSGPISVDRNGNLIPPLNDIRGTSEQGAEATEKSNAYLQAMEASLSLISMSLTSAILGGVSPRGAKGATIGSQVGGLFGTALQTGTKSALAAGLGSVGGALLGSVFPIVGTLVGGLIGSLFKTKQKTEQGLPPAALKANTDSLRDNTDAIRSLNVEMNDLRNELINAPGRFTAPAMIGQGFRSYVGGPSFSIVINGGSDSGSKSIANEVVTQISQMYHMQGRTNSNNSRLFNR